MLEKALFNWSGGKDSALSLYFVLQTKQYQVVSLLTSVSDTYNRVSMHGVREELLDLQAQQIGLPISKVRIPERLDSSSYDVIMQTKMQEFANNGVTISIFGDIFLEDLRKYREDKLALIAMTAFFPLWKMDTALVLKQFLALGFKTIVTCVNEKYLDQSFVGRIIDEAFMRDLPSNVDPCGENGEFHTFVFDGPIFQKPIPFSRGEIIYRKYASANSDLDTGFWFIDLLPQ